MQQFWSRNNENVRGTLITKLTYKWSAVKLRPSMFLRYVSRNGLVNLLVRAASFVMSLWRWYDTVWISNRYFTPGMRSPISTLTGCSSDMCGAMRFCSVMFLVWGGSSSPSAAHLTTYVSTRPSGRGHSRVTLVESTSGAMFDTGFGPATQQKYRSLNRLWT